MDSNKENQDAGCNGTIYHEGFKFHRKYVGKKTRLIGAVTIALKTAIVTQNSRSTSEER